MTRTWLITWTTYATWLPGDARGFVGDIRTDDAEKVIHNGHGTEYEQGNPALRKAMKEILSGEPVWLTPEQGVAVAGQIRETMAYRKWILLAVAVMPNHAHVLVTVLETVHQNTILRDLKAYASGALNRLGGKTTGGRWWTHGGSTRLKTDDWMIQTAFAYVRDQPGALCVWIDEHALAGL
ncbi:transposase [Zavarzinella formosa]|uniref:transposase n=1 Tax=Zavarzinella formosa TaxID=360055 RepID=UPI0003061C96|nr:transposase [Zavarzinella formosa]